MNKTKELKCGDEVDISKMRRGRWYYIGKSMTEGSHIVQSHQSCGPNGYHGGDLYEVKDEYISLKPSPEEIKEKEIDDLAGLIVNGLDNKDGVVAVSEELLLDLHNAGLRFIDGELKRID